MASTGGSKRATGGARRWIVFGAKLLVAAALLTFVATRVTWRDTARPPGEQATELTGAIELESSTTMERGRRPWDAEVVRFRFAAGEAPALDERVAAVAGDSELRALRTGSGGWRVTPGLPLLLSHMRLPLYGLGALCFLMGMSIAALRWWMLLASARIELSFGKCFRLTFIGQFFNTVVPGLTGGDIVKAFLVARHTDRRAEAVVSVFVDRILGLIALALLAGVAVLFVAREQPAVAWSVLAFVAAMIGGLALFFSRPLRRLLRLEERLARLPGGGLVRKVDEAVFVYRFRLGTVGWSLLLSFVNHLVTIAGVCLIGVALANEAQRASLLDLLVIYPVVGVISAVPIAPAGLGIGEGLFGSFYAMFGRSYDIGVLTSVIYRLTFIGWSLLGGIFLLTGRERVPSDPREGEGFAAPPPSATLEAR